MKKLTSAFTALIIMATCSNAFAHEYPVTASFCHKNNPQTRLSEDGVQVYEQHGSKEVNGVLVVDYSVSSFSTTPCIYQKDLDLAATQTQQ